MNADERRFFDSLTECVLGAIFEVANTPGNGFLEKIYERALLKELSLLGIQAVSEYVGDTPTSLSKTCRWSNWNASNAWRPNILPNA